MRRNYILYKGISTGLIIKKDLRKLGMTQRSLSEKINMPYGRLNRIINGSGYFNEDESRRIGRELDYEPLFIFQLQLQEKTGSKKEDDKIVIIGNIPNVRKCVFWDVDMATIDWIKHRKFILERVERYGNESERMMIERFYSNISKG